MERIKQVQVNYRIVPGKVYKERKVGTTPCPSVVVSSGPLILPFRLLNDFLSGSPLFPTSRRILQGRRLRTRQSGSCSGLCPRRPNNRCLRKSVLERGFSHVYLSDVSLPPTIVQVSLRVMYRCYIDENFRTKGQEDTTTFRYRGFSIVSSRRFWHRITNRT